VFPFRRYQAHCLGLAVLSPMSYNRGRRRTSAPTVAPPPVPETTNGISRSRRRGGTGFGSNHQTGTEIEPILLVTDLQERSLSEEEESTLSSPLTFTFYRKIYKFASCIKMTA